MAADNKTLGRFILDGIPPAPRGIPQIEVTFDIDADGILHVSAQDKATGRVQEITITASSGLNKDEIDQMVQNADKFREEDVKRREEVETRNNADSLIYQAEKLLKEQAEQVPEEVKSEVEGKVAACRSALQGEDIVYMQRTVQDLSEALQKLGASMYQQPEPPPPESDEESSAPPDDDEDVVEGEFSEA
jgi:molecular chaperone DnaK